MFAEMRYFQNLLKEISNSSDNFPTPVESHEVISTIIEIPTTISDLDKVEEAKCLLGMMENHLKFDY